MQLMTKRCSALLLKNQMSQLLSQSTTPFLLDDKDIQTTKTHIHHPQIPSYSHVSEFQLEQPSSQPQPHQHSFGKLIERVQSVEPPQRQPFRKKMGSNSNSSCSGQRLKIERDENKLKIVRMGGKRKEKEENMKRVVYDSKKKEVTIGIQGMFDQSVFTPERIEEIFDKAVTEILNRIKTQRPKQFRGDSFSASVQITK